MKDSEVLKRSTQLCTNRIERNDIYILKELVNIIKLELEDENARSKY